MMITIYYMQDKENTQATEIGISCKGLTGSDTDSLYFYSYGLTSPIYHEAPYSLANILLERYHILQQIILPTKEDMPENSHLLFSVAAVIAGCRKYIKECNDDKLFYQYEAKERSSKTYPIGLIILDACLKAGIRLPLKILSLQTISDFMQQVEIVAEKLNSVPQASSAVLARGLNSSFSV